MKLSWNWLADYVDLSGLTPRQVADALTNAGLEIEGDLEAIGPQFQQVVVGQVLSLEAHPNADKLRLVTVDLGPQLGTTRVVCGASNVAVDQRIAFALNGATVFSKKTGQWFTLTPAVIRGVASEGMICSLEELGLEDHYPAPENGIWPLTDLTTRDHLGQDLKAVLQLSGDTLLHSAPTANRGDWMSYRGVAREISALFGKTLSSTSAFSLPEASASAPYALDLPTPDTCSIYAGAFLTGATVGPSPDFVRQRLEAAGIRSINNVVDVTNYVLLETGQPLHAFDADCLGPQATIGVRYAQPGETLVTLDAQVRTLDGDGVVITCNNQPVALAGVMGGQDTAITETSTRIFLEAACFPSATTRRSARSQGIRTESSARFERGVDSGQTWQALGRAVQLLQEWSGAQIQWTVQAGQPATSNRQITLPLGQLETLIGRDYQPERVVSVLQPLGFALVGQSGDRLTFSVPSWRQQDVAQPIDLIEEVVRIDGYDNVPATLPRQSAMALQSTRQTVLARIRQALLGLGLQEVMTPSLVGPALLNRAQVQQDPALEVRLTNSANQEEHDRMRQGLMANLLEVARYNVAQGETDFWLFELGRSYWMRGKPGHKQTGVQEKLQLGLLWCGQVTHPHWQTLPSPDFYTAKGSVESLLAHLDLAHQVDVEPLIGADCPACLHPGRSARFVVKATQKTLGILGQVHPLVQKELRLKSATYIAELDGDLLLKLAQTGKAPEPMSLSDFPAMERDIALCVPDQVSHAQLMAALQAQAPDYLDAIHLFDQYRGDKLPQGHRGLAYRVVLRSLTGTLTDRQADETIEQLKTAATTLPGVQLR